MLDKYIHFSFHYICLSDKSSRTISTYSYLIYVVDKAFWP